VIHQGGMMMRRTQSGISLIGLLFWAVVVAFVALLVMKIVPAVTEYQTIKTMVDKVARDGGSTVPEIRAAFDRAQQVEYGVDSIRAIDLDITKEGDKIVIKFAYDKEIELMDPVYLVIKYQGQSK